MDKQHDDAYTYRFYIEAGRTPIRTVYDSNKLRIGADAFDQNTGLFKPNTRLLANLDSPDIDEVTEERFYTFCQNLFAKSTPKPDGLKGMQ